MTQELFDSLNDEDKIILYSVGALDRTPLRSKVKLQKLIFLMSNVFPDFKNLLEYEPHLLGPYSEIVDNVVDELISRGLILKEGSSFSLSKEGFALFNKLKPKEELKIVIDDFKEFLNDLPDDEILAFIYVTYPKYIAESAKWDDLKRNRDRIAISLLKKKKVSFGKAAEIAGMNQVSFEDLLKRNNVRWRD